MIEVRGYSFYVLLAIHVSLALASCDLKSLFLRFGLVIRPWLGGGGDDYSRPLIQEILFFFPQRKLHKVKQ